MTKLAKTFAEFSQNAAQEFIQTAVFVDDRIYDEKRQKVAKPDVILPKGRKKTKSIQSEEPKALLREDGNETRTETSGDLQNSNLEDQSDSTPHSYEIMRGFAKKQIVCALYQPEKRAGYTKSSVVYSLCKSADVIVLDWVLHGDDGGKVLTLMKSLVDQAIHDLPEQHRLIIIYTGKLNLAEVGDDVFKVLKSVDQNINVDERNLVFNLANCRVSIIGKPSERRPEHYKDREIKESDLADFAIKDFSLLASGLMQAIVLYSMARIKRNSRKVLSKFGSHLDSAFLTHRALSLPHEEATNHLIPLLVSEMEAVLEDCLDRPLLRNEIISDWCRQEWQPGSHLIEDFHEEKLKEIASGLVVKGLAVLEDHESDQYLKKWIKKSEDHNSGEVTFKLKGEKDNLRRFSRFLMQSSDSTENHEFSKLMSCRTYYGDLDKVLKLGTIVKKNNGESFAYYLCLQPLCDSVRLREPRKFIFAELEVPEPKKDYGFSHATMTMEAEPIEFLYDPRPFRSFIAVFDPKGKNKEICSKRNGEKQVFKDINKQEYVWVDQLKPAHAQRAVESFARNLSRVGLIESEWQRLLGK